MGHSEHKGTHPSNFFFLFPSSIFLNVFSNHICSTSGGEFCLRGGPFYKKQIRILGKVGAMNTNYLLAQGAHAPLEFVK